jgi:hypothetical protein
MALVSKLGITPWIIAAATGGPVSTSGNKSGSDAFRICRNVFGCSIVVVKERQVKNG